MQISLIGACFVEKMVNPDATCLFTVHIRELFGITSFPSSTILRLCLMI